MRGTLTPDQIQQANEMRAKNMSFRAIARELGSTSPTVKRAIEVPKLDRSNDPNRLVEKLVGIPAKHLEALKGMMAKCGYENLNQLIRAIIRKELETTGAISH